MVKGKWEVQRLGATWAEMAFELAVYSKEEVEEALRKERWDPRLAALLVEDVDREREKKKIEEE